jgi:hypothetical protein
VFWWDGPSIWSYCTRMYLHSTWRQYCSRAAKTPIWRTFQGKWERKAKCTHAILLHTSTFWVIWTKCPVSLTATDARTASQKGWMCVRRGSTVLVSVYCTRRCLQDKEEYFALSPAIRVYVSQIVPCVFGAGCRRSRHRRWGRKRVWCSHPQLK